MTDVQSLAEHGTLPAAPPLAPKVAAKEENLYTAKPRQLIWWRFRKHKLAVVSLWFMIILTALAVFADFAEQAQHLRAAERRAPLP
jgi:peptide/nickel transport system permease protein